MAREPTTDHIAVFRRKPKNGDHAPHGLQRVGNEESLFQKPTLLCCGGMFVNTKHEDGEKGCNGYAKIAHGLLCYPDHFPSDTMPQHKPDIDIVSICYPETAQSLMHKHHQHMDTLKNNSHPAPTAFARRFAEQHLFPLVEKSDGVALPLDTIKRNLRNIEVLAHSYGSTFIQQVGDVLVDKLEQLHLTPEEIRDATSQVLVVEAGPITPPATGKASFTSISIININDTQIKNSYDSQTALKELFQKEDLLVDRKNQPVDPEEQIDHRNNSGYYPAKPLNILPIATRANRNRLDFSRTASNQWLVCASQPIFINGMGDIIQTQTIPNLERSNERGIFDGGQPVGSDDTHHQPVTYFSAKRPSSGKSRGPSEHTEHASTLRTLMSSLLINGMNNAIINSRSDEFTPLPNADVLMQLPPSTEYITSLDVPLRRMAKLDDYDNKIARGLGKDRPSSQERTL